MIIGKTAVMNRPRKALTTRIQIVTKPEIKRELIKKAKLENRTLSNYLIHKGLCGHEDNV